MATKIKAQKITDEQRAEMLEKLRRHIPKGTRVTCIQTYVNDSGLRAYMILVPLQNEGNGSLYICNFTQEVGELLGYRFTKHRDRLLSIYTTGFAPDVVGHLSEALYGRANELLTSYYTESFYRAAGNKA